MTWRSIFVGRWRRAGVIAGLVIVGLLICARVFLMTPMAHSIVESRAEALSVRGQTIALDRVHGDLFFGVRADRLSIRDDDGVWLEAQDARISWRLVPMIFGHLDLREIRAESINVERRPNPALASGPSGAAPFDKYSIGSLSIAELSLMEGVAGPAQTYQLAGRLEAEGWAGKLHLDLIPTGGRGDEVQADIVWGGDALLEGEIDLAGAPDGVIAQVLGLRAGEGVTASLNASGGLLGGELVAQAQIGSETVLDLEGKADRRDYKATGRIDLSRLQRFQSIAQRIGGELEFEASIDPTRRLAASVTAPTGITQITGDLSSSDEARLLENFVFNATGLDVQRLSGVSGLSAPELNASGRLSQANGKVAFEGRLDAPALSYRSYQFGTVASEGLIDFISGTISVGTNLDFVLKDGFPANAKAALGTSAMASIDAHFSLPRSLLSIDGASLRGEKLSLSGRGTLRPGGPVALTGSFDLQDVSILETVSGRFELNGHSVSNLGLTSDGTARPLASAPQLLQELAPTLDYKINASRRDAVIALDHAELRSDAVSATIRGDIAPNEIALMGQAEARLDAQVEGLDGPLGSQFSISGTPDEPSISIYLNGAYQDDPILAELNGQVQDGRLVLSELYGEWRLLVASGNGAIELAALPDSSLELNINGRVPNVSDLTAEVSYKGRELASQVSVRGFEAGETVVDEAKAHLSGTWPQFEGAATYQATVPVSGAPQKLVGTHPLELDAQARSLIVGGNATIGDQTITMISPLLISVDPEIQMEGVFAAFGGEIDLDFANAGARPSRLTLKEIALADLTSLVQRPGLTGTMNGDVDVRLGEQGPSGSGSLRIVDLSRTGLDRARANLVADAQLSDGLLIATASVTPSAEDVSLEASLSTDLIDTGSVMSIRQSPGALTPIRITGSGDISPLWALAGLDMRLEGQFGLNLTNGEGRTFGFSGPISLTNGTFEDGITGIYLEEFETELQLDPEAITVKQATARGARGGSITASGNYRFNGDSDLSANLTRLRALRREDVSTTLSGQASIERRDHRTHVEGDIQVDEMRIDLSKLPRAGYTVLDVQFDDGSENDNTDQTPTREAISLNLDIRADRRVFVDGTIFESEWGVDANVRGSPGDPILTGAATLVRGEANVIGQRFNLSEGRIQFAGPPSDSELYLQTDRTSDGVTTMITLSGEVADPEITLGSDPSLPEDEVLARVLFGRSPSNLSPLQAAQLASAAAQVAGGDAFSFTGELQDATGLDRLDFGLDDEGQATLSTGKYLADDVYLEIESGATGAPAVALEWTPLANVEVDAEVDPELGPKVAIQWKRDFDRLPGEPRKD